MNRTILVCAVVLAGCAVESEEAQRTTELNIPPLLPSLPLVFYVFDDTGSDCAAAASDANIREGVRLANDEWLDAGVRFSIRGIIRFNAPSFWYIDSTKRPYEEVGDQLPMVMGGGMHAWGLPSMTNEGWLHWAAEHAVHPHLMVMVPCAEAPDVWWGHVSTESRIAHIPAPLIATSLVGYHLGDYFDLVHPIEVGIPYPPLDE